MSNAPLKPLSAEACSVKPGMYEHYKGNRYEVVFVGRHTETLEEVVIYRAENTPEEIWVRPVWMFVEKAMLPTGDSVPRFRPVR